jgi:molybdenum ABC transporter molybdate-binding protein
VAVELTTVTDDSATFHDGTAVDVVAGLGADTAHERHGISFRTLPTPSGVLRCRIGTVNDVHFGEIEAGRIDDLAEGPVRRAEPGEPPYPETMNRAATSKLLADGTRIDFAQNTLVLIVPAAAAQTPKQLSELTGASYARVATGTPATVPVGRYTMGAVEQAGLTAALQPKWIYGESVRQVLNYVARGEVDAGFVYRTDALIERDKTRIALTVPTTTPVSYPIAQIATSQNAALAKDFIAFVRSAPGQQVLQRFGFSKP